MCSTNMDPFGWGDFDRESVNDSDDQHFWGSDNDDGTTSWYTDDGTLDCVTDTPSDEDDW